MIACNWFMLYGRLHKNIYPCPLFSPNQKIAKLYILRAAMGIYPLYFPQFVDIYALIYIVQDADYFLFVCIFYLLFLLSFTGAGAEVELGAE